MPSSDIILRPSPGAATDVYLYSTTVGTTRTLHVSAEGGTGGGYTDADTYDDTTGYLVIADVARAISAFRSAATFGVGDVTVNLDVTIEVGYDENSSYDDDTHYLPRITQTRISLNGRGIVAVRVTPLVGRVASVTAVGQVQVSRTVTGCRTASVLAIGTASVGMRVFTRTDRREDIPTPRGSTVATARAVSTPTNRSDVIYAAHTTYDDQTLYVLATITARALADYTARLASSPTTRDTAAVPYDGTTVYGADTDYSATTPRHATTATDRGSVIEMSYDATTNYGDLTLYVEEIVALRRMSVVTPRRS